MTGIKCSLLVYFNFYSRYISNLNLNLAKTYINLIIGVSQLWNRYKVLIENAVSFGEEKKTTKNIAYWQNELFKTTILYSLPIGLLVVIPSAIVIYGGGNRLVPVFDVLTLVFSITVIFSKRINLLFKKILTLLMLTMLAIVLISSLASFGIGSIYLLAVGVYIALHFSGKIAYASVGLNCLIYLSFAVIIHFKLFSSPLIQKYTTDLWLAYSLSFVFLNVTTIVAIRHMVNGLAETVLEEERLLTKLTAEIAEGTRRSLLIKESEAQYMSLFFLNPTPMWIFDLETLRFLQVNDAAVHTYAYTSEEFMKMSINDIRSEKIELILDNLKLTLKTDIVFKHITLHRNKAGHEFTVEINCSTILFNQRTALLATARDITNLVNHAQAVEEQNERLKKIAYMQSHIVRAPLAKIKGLTEIIRLNDGENHDKQLFTYLESAVDELDKVIINISTSSREIKPEKRN
jgi:PAS domain S-box-containing protein